MTTDKTSTAVVNPEAAKGADTVVDPRLLVREQGLGGYITEFKRKMRGGDLGSIPVIIGLLIICVVFQSLNSEFLSAKNVSDIAVTMVATGMMAVGIIFVLLLGEIDLSVGSVSGVAGAIVAVLSAWIGSATAKASHTPLDFAPYMPNRHKAITIKLSATRSVCSRDGRFLGLRRACSA